MTCDCAFEYTSHLLFIASSQIPVLFAFEKVRNYVHLKLITDGIH